MKATHIRQTYRVGRIFDLPAPHQMTENHSFSVYGI